MTTQDDTIKKETLQEDTESQNSAEHSPPPEEKDMRNDSETSSANNENREQKKEPEENKDDMGKNKNVLEEFGEQIGKFATSTIDTLKKGVDKALVSRNTVLTIRVTDEANRKLSMLVETGLFKSRSESASFLIEEGIKQQVELFGKIGSKMDEIDKLRADLKNIVSEEFKTPE